MNWEQKLQAIQSLCGWLNVKLRMRTPGNWCVDCPCEIKTGSVLHGFVGEGVKPEDAVNDQWRQMTEIGSQHYLVVLRDNERLARRWNGFMWEEVNEKTNRTEIA